MTEPEDPAASSVTPAESDKWNLQLWEKFEDKTAGQIQLSDAEIQTILDSIFSQDFAVRQQTINRMTHLGTTISKHLVETLVKNTTNNTLLFQVTYALEIIGKPAVKPLLDALNQITELKTPLDIALLENITETLIRLNDNNAAPTLARHIKASSDEINKINKESNGNDSQTNSSIVKKVSFCQSIRLKLHDLLGEMKAADGLDDLLLLLDDGRKRVHEDVIETLAKIGDRRALLPLIRLYSVEMTVSELGARYIRLACRDIIKREKIVRIDPIFKELSPEEQKILNDIFPNQRLERPNTIK